MIERLEEWIGVIAAVVLIALIFLVFNAMTSLHEEQMKTKAELFNKYPECLQASEPIMCIRYKREIERLGL